MISRISLVDPDTSLRALPPHDPRTIRLPAPESDEQAAPSRPSRSQPASPSD